MKKTAILTLLIAATAVTSFGQGAVNFNNRVTGAGGVVAPIYGVNPLDPMTARIGNATTNGGAVDRSGYPLLFGTGFSAALLYGADAGNLSTYATVTFRTVTGFGGFITPPSPAPQTAPTTATSFRVRAWDNGGNTASSYADALAAGRGVGESAVFTVSPLASPATPPALVGLTSFNLTIVPEPGVIALGVLGLGALLLRRRK